MMNMKCLLSVLCFAPGSAQYMLTANVGTELNAPKF